MNYYLIFLIIIIITYICISKILKFKNKDIIFLNVAFIEMLLFLGFRDTTIGIDLQNYIPYFNIINGLNLDNLFYLPLERGYVILNKLVGLVGGENVFLFVVAFISLLGVYYSIKKYSKNYMLSVFIYITFQFYIFIFSGLRQGIAFSIVWLSLKYVKERKLVKFILIVLLASMFHKTALIFLPVYFIANKRITLKYVLLFLVVFISMLILKVQLVTFVTSFLYSTYAVSNTSGGYSLLVLLFAVFVFFILIRNKKIENFRDNDIWFNMLIVAILIQTLASTQGNIARLTMYYSFSVVLLIPNVLDSLKDKKQKIFIEAIVYISLFIFYFISIQNEANYMPYKLFF